MISLFAPLLIFRYIIKHTLIISRPFLFLATIVVAFMVMMGESNVPQYIEYTTVTGFFQQDDPATEPNGFDYVSTSNPQLRRELMLFRQQRISA